MRSHPATDQLRRLLLFLSISKALLLVQLRVPHADCKGNQRHCQADSCDAEQPLDVFIGLHGALSLRCIHGICSRKGVGVSIGISGNCCIANSRVELLWKYLGPNGAGNSISQRTSDVITGQEKTSDHSKVCSRLASFHGEQVYVLLTLMLGCGLDASLGRIREQTAS